MDDKTLFIYINDTLHNILGYSDKTTSEYILSIAKKNNINLLINALKTSGVEQNKASTFAEELCNKVPHQITQVNVVAKQRQLEEKKLIELQKKK